MRKIITSLTIVTLILIFFSSVSNAQGKLGVVGKQFSKKEANILFGKVIGSIDVDAKVLQAALDKANDYVLFTIKHNQVIIRNEKRQPLSNENENLGNNEIMYVFSKSEVEKLLQSATPKAGVTSLSSVTSTASVSVVTFEVRASVLTLSTNTETLELSVGCPPFCGD